MKYDIFYVSKHQVRDDLWQEFKGRFPNAQRINNLQNLDQLKKKSFTKFFWVVWDDIKILPSFSFDYRIPTWDEEWVHVFKNGEHFDGVCIFSKDVDVSQREFDNRFFIDKKEIDVQASIPLPYEKYHFTSYEEYMNAVENSKTEMFWATWDDQILKHDFHFDYQVIKHNQNIVHVFKNGEFYDGICLFPKRYVVSKKEFDFRFFTNKKEIGITATIPKPFDIVFLSFNEPSANENYAKMMSGIDLDTHKVFRLNGVKGIHNAHIEAAKLTTTEMFWVVDADAIISEDFDFTFEQIPFYDKKSREVRNKTVHVWHSKNPINDLIYGYGGVKLLPRQMTIDMDTSKPDMTTSISDYFKIMPGVSNLTSFNVDEFSTWRSAFRECVKLSSKVIDRTYDKETEDRLEIWCTQGSDRPYGEYAIAGAQAGRQYGSENIGNLSALEKINDFDWLKEKYKEHNV